MNNETIIYDINEFEKNIINIVEKAVDLIKNSKFEIEEKDGPVNIVTSHDIMVQDFLCKELSHLIPEAGFFCEEGMDDTENEYLWIIDPIDGTTNYARSIANCVISVALVHKGIAIAGVVYNIFSGDIFSAVKGGGARLNGKDISVSQNKFENGLLCTAMSLYKKEFAKVCNDIIYEAYMQCNDVRRFGSGAVELCYIAAGMCDLYFEIRVFPWDYAAAYLILTEAGGVLRGFDGEELDFSKPTVLVGANTYENYQKLNEIVLKHLDRVPY